MLVMGVGDQKSKCREEGQLEANAPDPKKAKDFGLVVSRQASSMSPLNTPFQPRTKCSTNCSLVMSKTGNWESGFPGLAEAKELASVILKRWSPCSLVATPEGELGNSFCQPQQITGFRAPWKRVSGQNLTMKESKGRRVERLGRTDSQF